MSEKLQAGTSRYEHVRVGTTGVTFHLTAFDHQEELAIAYVNVPIYASNGNMIGNESKGLVSATVPDDFTEKVKQAFQVFADTLQASFREEENDDKH